MNDNKDCQTWSYQDAPQNLQWFDGAEGTITVCSEFNQDAFVQTIEFELLIPIREEE